MLRGNGHCPSSLPPPPGFANSGSNMDAEETNDVDQNWAPLLEAAQSRWTEPDMRNQLLNRVLAMTMRPPNPVNNNCYNANPTWSPHNQTISDYPYHHHHHHREGNYNQNIAAPQVQPANPNPSQVIPFVPGVPLNGHEIMSGNMCQPGSFIPPSMQCWRNNPSNNGTPSLPSSTEGLPDVIRQHIGCPEGIVMQPRWSMKEHRFIYENGDSLLVQYYLYDYKINKGKQRGQSQVPANCHGGSMEEENQNFNGETNDFTIATNQPSA